MKVLKFLFILALFSIAGCTRRTSEPPMLTIYTYDSFSTEWGLEPVVIPPFEDICKCEVQVVTVGDGGAILNRLVIEGKETRADIILGLDNNLAARAFELDIFEPYKPKYFETVPEEIWFDPSNRLIPFDYGYFSVVYDSEKLRTPPKHFTDLTSAEYKRRLIVEDPRSSTPGLGFLLWSIKLLENRHEDFWQKLKANILTVTPGWDSAYAMFKKGEAPMVISYTTSPAYHIINENTDRYKAAIFPEGHYIQIEVAGIVKYTKNKNLAQSFIDYMLSPQFQKEIPTKNYMYPANKDVELPEAFKSLPKPKKMLIIKEDILSKKLAKWINGWRQAMQ
ncbi:MAG: thiamine ABC transporter substrate binding subunit [Deltaproteobacteria bacterium RIFCSPHIGHO2_12_FULL_43_9]|nr:MAG: thiamine ABC transporter substrate binding subunit [Deltaproteobacteria bacterium RIFCSPHIGHO2_12_FULL_43_9]